MSTVHGCYCIQVSRECLQFMVVTVYKSVENVYRSWLFLYLNPVNVIERNRCINLYINQFEVKSSWWNNSVFEYYHAWNFSVWKCPSAWRTIVFDLNLYAHYAYAGETIYGCYCIQVSRKCLLKLDVRNHFSSFFFLEKLSRRHMRNVHKDLNQTQWFFKQMGTFKH
jgi:hypothetical protein